MIDNVSPLCMFFTMRFTNQRKVPIRPVWRASSEPGPALVGFTPGTRAQHVDTRTLDCICALLKPQYVVRLGVLPCGHRIYAVSHHTLHTCNTGQSLKVEFLKFAFGGALPQSPEGTVNATTAVDASAPPSGPPDSPILVHAQPSDACSPLQVR
jgi:hypothetical protein